MVKARGPNAESAPGALAPQPGRSPRRRSLFVGPKVQCRVLHKRHNVTPPDRPPGCRCRCFRAGCVDSRCREATRMKQARPFMMRPHQWLAHRRAHLPRRPAPSQGDGVGAGSRQPVRPAASGVVTGGKPSRPVSPPGRLFHRRCRRPLPDPPDLRPCP